MSLRTPHSALRICFVVPGFPTDETDWFKPAVTETILAMSKRYDIYVVTLRYPEKQMHYRIQDIPVSSVVKGRIRTIKSGLDYIRKEHRRKPFHLIHAFWGTMSGMTGAIASLRLGIPLIVTCAGGEPVARDDIHYGDWRSFIPYLYITTSFSIAARIIVGSDYQYELVTGRSPAWGQKAVSIPLGIDTRRFHPETGHEKKDSITILHVAGLVPVKNQHFLLQALARLTDRPWRLEIVGDGPLKEELQTLSRTLGIGNRIDWQGWVHHDEIAACYQRGDLFVLTSEHEAQGVVLLEAMACGLPVVATEVGLAPELVDAGACVPRSDEQALADAIASFLDDSEKRRDTGQHNRQIAEQYDQEVTVNRLAEVYESIIGNNTDSVDH